MLLRGRTITFLCPFGFWTVIPTMLHFVMSNPPLTCKSKCPNMLTSLARSTSPTFMSGHIPTQTCWDSSRSSLSPSVNSLQSTANPRSSNSKQPSSSSSLQLRPACHTQHIPIKTPATVHLTRVVTTQLELMHFPAILLLSQCFHSNNQLETIIQLLQLPTTLRRQQNRRQYHRWRKR